MEWRSRVACVRSDRFEGGARLVGAGTAPRRRCTGAAWRPGRRGRRARLRAGAAAAWAWAGEALLAKENARPAGTRARPWAGKPSGGLLSEMKKKSFLFLK